MEQLEKDEIFGQYSPGVTAKYRYETNISQLATLPVSSIIPSRDKDLGTMMTDIEAQISRLVQDGLLEYEHPVANQAFKGWQFEDLHVTPTGKYFIQSFLGGLAPAIREKKKYDNLIKEAEASSELKDFLRETYKKLKSATQEEIAHTLLSTVKKHGVPLLIVLIKMASGHNDMNNDVHP